MITVRAESGSDHEGVWRVNQAAFGGTNEANLVEALRKAAHPYVSLVAVEGGNVVGHIFFSAVSIETDGPVVRGWGLGPMAVLPEYQRRGTGSLLVREGLCECQRLGGEIVVVLGHAEYYPRFGFQKASSKGLRSEYQVPDEVFMVVELSPGALAGVKGLVKYHEAFGAV